MNDLNELINDPIYMLAFKFFIKFARFENALKATKYNKGEGQAHPNWDDFAKDIDSQFKNSQLCEFCNAVEFFLLEPPMEQVIRNGKLKFEQRIPNNCNYDAKLVFIYIRRVRNNLFHGGKFGSVWYEPERSEKLLRNSLTILEACLEFSPEVKNAYAQN